MNFGSLDFLEESSSLDISSSMFSSFFTDHSPLILDILIKVPLGFLFLFSKRITISFSIIVLAVGRNS